MSAIETAVKTAIQNVIQSLVEKHLGDNLPVIMAQVKEALEKVNTFDGRLASIERSLIDIHYKLDLQSTGGMSIAEQIEFGGANVIHETSEGVDKGSFDTLSLEQMQNKLRVMANDGSNDSGSGTGSAFDLGGGPAPI